MFLLFPLCKKIVFSSTDLHSEIMHRIYAEYTDTCIIYGVRVLEIIIQGIGLTLSRAKPIITVQVLCIARSRKCSLQTTYTI